MTMKIFGALYNRVMHWSRHRLAMRYLAAVSFAESSFFPVPTVVMLAPMVLANRRRAWRLATLATVTSVAGGVFGYFIGYALFDEIGRPIIAFYNAGESFESLRNWFGVYGVWLVLLAGVTPIPYKIFTIASGLPRLIINIIYRRVNHRSRNAIFLVAWLLWFGGEKLERVIVKWMEPLGWSLLVIVVASYWLLT